MNFFVTSHRVILLDLIGHGKSLGTGSITDTTEVLRAILDVEGMKQIHLVGVSLGGILAQDFANRYPEKMLSLTVIGAYDINDVDHRLIRKNSKKQMLMLLKGFISIRQFAEANRKVSAITPAASEKFYQLNLKYPKRSFRHLASLKDIIGKHQTISRAYPFLIMVGDHDMPELIDASQAWARKEETARFAFVENAGHLANMDQPERVNEVLANLFSSLSEC